MPATSTSIGHDVGVGVGVLARVLSRETSQLSRTALAVLAALREGPKRITELAAAEHVAQPTMTVLVSRLEARGWIERSADERDRRAVNVALTDAGRDVIADVVARRAAFLDERIARLSAAERDALAAAVPVLHRLAEPA